MSYALVGCLGDLEFTNIYSEDHNLSSQYTGHVHIPSKYMRVLSFRIPRTSGKLLIIGVITNSDNLHIYDNIKLIRSLRDIVQIPRDIEMYIYYTHETQTHYYSEYVLDIMDYINNMTFLHQFMSPVAQQITDGLVHRYKTRKQRYDLIEYYQDW